mmetsp:Transcript_114593/g.228051  ORF Transcript_114593/g.228051 Transcript_114593/m.228051 type:complete len:163 (+) Transcript_114593:155-643(+)
MHKFGWLSLLARQREQTATCAQKACMPENVSCKFKLYGHVTAHKPTHEQNISYCQTYKKKRLYKHKLPLPKLHKLRLILTSGQAPALPPAIHIFERVKRGKPAIRARCKLAARLPKQLVVIHISDAEMVQTMLHVIILTPALPQQLRFAFPLVVKVCLQGLF